jgi:acid phosphatase
MPRTIESLHQIIQGLYPPSSHSQEDSLRIPFMVRNWMDENLYPNAICKRLRQLDAESIKRAAKEQNPQLERLDEKLKPLFNNGVGIRIDSTSPRASGVLDTLMVCRAHGIKVPSVLDDVDVLRTLENGVVHEWFVPIFQVSNGFNI